MNQNVRKEVFDKLTLRVEPRLSDPCRRIVPEDSEKTCYVQADGQLYEDGIWKVQLVTMRIPFNGQLQYRIRVDYKGQNALPGVRCYGRMRAFDAGIINLSIRDYRREDGSVGSEIDIAKISYSDLLSDKFGIWDGYFLESPNITYSADRGDDSSLAVMSDGEVTCWLGDEFIKNPESEDLVMVTRAGEPYYEVSGATWTVVIRFNKYNQSEARIEVCTEECDFEKLFESLEQYLAKMELTRFDDLLDMILE